MKRLDFVIDKPTKEKFFPPYRLSTRIDICKIVIEILRHALSYPVLENPSIEKDRLTLYVDDMTRAFLFSDDQKYYSIGLPFILNTEPITFRLGNIVIDSPLLYKISSIIEDIPEDLGQYDPLETAVMLDDAVKKYPGINQVYFTLLTYEFGYVRYDNDPIGYKNAYDPGRPKLHPKHHLDINIAGHSTYKKGLSKHIGHDTFIEILDNKQNRWMLSKP